MISIGILLIGGISLWVFTKESQRQGPTTIRVINQSRWSQTIEQAVKQWNNTHPTQQVVLDQLIIGYPQLRNKLITACGAGRPPDISILDSVWTAEFAQAGHLAALDEIDPEWFNEDYTKDFFPVFQRSDMFNGHLWGVRTQTDMAILWYRKDWLAGENLDPPKTWKDLVNTGMYFKKEAVRNRYGNSKYPLALPLGQKARETLVYQLLPVLWSNGGGVFRNGKLILDAKENIEALNFLKDLVHTHKIVSPEAVTFEWNRAMKLLATGKAALAFGGSYEKRMMQEVSGWDDAEFFRHVGYTLIPSGPRGERSTTAGGMCYVVYEGSAYQKLAFEIVKLATSKEIMKQFLLTTYQHPPRISIAEGLDESINPFLAETADFLYQAKTRPTFPEYSSLSDLLQEMVEKSVREDAEPVSVLKEACRKIRDLIDQGNI
ncbi:MAG: ABC transporter substrate-binding protein [Thermodesulfobacteriota bacterium]